MWYPLRKKLYSSSRKRKYKQNQTTLTIFHPSNRVIKSWQKYQSIFRDFHHGSVLLTSWYCFDIDRMSLTQQSADVLREHIKSKIINNTLIGPLLDDMLKENLRKQILKPWKDVLCFHFRVCLCVSQCASYRAHLLT